MPREWILTPEERSQIAVERMSLGSIKGRVRSAAPVRPKAAALVPRVANATGKSLWGGGPSASLSLASGTSGQFSFSADFSSDPILDYSNGLQPTFVNSGLVVACIEPVSVSMPNPSTNDVFLQTTFSANLAASYNGPNGYCIVYQTVNMGTNSFLQTSVTIETKVQAGDFLTASIWRSADGEGSNASLAYFLSLWQIL